jgi:hypothetical protein
VLLLTSGRLGIASFGRFSIAYQLGVLSQRYRTYQTESEFVHLSYFSSRSTTASCSGGVRKDDVCAARLECQRSLIG